jgi:hypothetical protein
VVYTPLSNYRYDSGPHQIQSGPNRESYQVVSSGIVDLGADYGLVVAGPPTSGIYSTDAWRAVPAAVLSAYEGYRPLGVSTIANAKVQTSYGPQWGVRDTGKYTYFGGTAPDNQAYNPYNTPEGNTAAQGHTGGQSLQQRYATTLLTNPTNDTSGSRASWIYHPPVYCQTFTEVARSETPGLMSTDLRYVYRGRAGNYVSNFASIYHQLPEGVRSIVRTYSPTVNSSNQKTN